LRARRCPERLRLCLAVRRHRARASVEALNLTDVHLTRTLFGISCSKSDHIYYKFSARNLSGQRVHGVVCMSYLKGATVRITG
jgi:hypothetical protein